MIGTVGEIAQLIKKCLEEPNIDKRIPVLQHINSMLPENERLKIPSLITNDYVDIVLYRIEDIILSAPLTNRQTAKSLVVLCAMKDADRFFEDSVVFDTIAVNGFDMKYYDCRFDCIQEISKLVYRGNRIHCVLLLGTPDDSSFNTIARKLKETCHAKIILVTTSERDVERNRHLVHEGFIDKTIKIDETNSVTENELGRALGDISKIETA